MEQQRKTSIEVISHTETSVCCRGESKALGHPAVYLDIPDDQQEVSCYYCGKAFRKEAQTKRPK